VIFLEKSFIMPIYEFRCNECDIDFDVVCGYNETVTQCEECGAEVEKILSIPAIHTAATRSTFSYRAKSNYVKQRCFPQKGKNI